MTQKEKNKYLLIYKLGGSITEEEYSLNRCGNCKILICVHANMLSNIKVKLIRGNHISFMNYHQFCLDFESKEKSQ